MRVDTRRLGVGTDRVGDRTRRMAWVTTAALALTLSMSTAAQAAGGLQTKTDSTFRLNPGQDHVKVNIDVKLTNRKAPTTAIRSCPSNPAFQCRVTTNYYYNQWGPLVVPAGATRLKIESPGVRSRVHSKDKYWTYYAITFPNLNFGQTRRIDASYELRGGKRDPNTARA